MSLSQQTRPRLPRIKEGLLKGDNYTVIGEACAVTRRTIDRDIATWIESEEFETWIKEEWLRLHQIIIDKDPGHAYDKVTQLFQKMIAHKVEKNINVKEQIEETITLQVTDDEDEILSKAAKILEGKTKLTKIH